MKSKLKVKRRDGLLLAIFYTAVGIFQLVILTLLDFRFFLSGALALLDFIVAYGLFTVKKWSVWLVIAIFFPQFVFGTVTLYASALSYVSYQEIAFMFLNVALAIFMVLSSVSFVYVAARRNSFGQG